MKGETILEIEKEKVYVRTFATPDEIENLGFDEQFSEHNYFRSLCTRKDCLTSRASGDDSNVVVALTELETIIGFGILSYTEEPFDRWSDLGPKQMMEVIAIEVSREWRSRGIGKTIARGMLSHPKAEEKIIYLVGYSWTWDLEGSNMPASEYRKMMIRLFRPQGFEEFKTNEPNIALNPDNLFMARIGKRVSEKVRNDFKWLCFGITP